MDTVRRHPYALIALAFALAAAAAVIVAGATGFSAVGHVFARIRPAWLAVVAGGQVVGALGYAFAYQAAARLGGGPRLPLPFALRAVTAGFGAFAAGGGFALDYQVLDAASRSRRKAVVRVLALGALEYAVLAPLACVAAIVMLAVGSKAMPSLLWPWALAPPIGFALAFAAAAKRERLTKNGKRRRLDSALRSISGLTQLAREPSCGIPAYAGMAVYWVAEMASLWGALRAFDISISLGALIVGYATGYAATRRTLPLGGAAATVVLMTYALHWTGMAVPAALAGVVTYRVFNLIVTTFPALEARRGLEPVLLGSR